MSSEIKKTVLDVSRALQELHRDLLMREAKLLEQEAGRKLTPYEILHASLNDPNMAWLRQLSSLIVNIDTITDETPNLSAQEASQISDTVNALLEKPGGLIDTDFWTRYAEYLQDPDVIMKHSKVKTLIGSLRPKM